MDKATFIEGTAVGAVAGVIAGLLPARRFGQETRDEVKADLVELRDKTVARLQTLEHLTQQKCEEVVTAVISGYSAAERLTVDQAKEREAKLRGGYEDILQTVHEHTVPETPAIA